MIRRALARFQQRYARLGIRAKLMLSFMLVISTAAVLISAWYTLRTTRYVQTGRERNFMELMNQTQISVDNIVSAAEDAGKSIVLNQTLEDILLYSDADHYTLSDQLDDYAYLSKYINTANVNDSIQSVRLYFAIDSIYTRERQNLFHAADAKNKRWYERALFVGGAPVWSHTGAEISCARAILRYDLPQSECGFVEIVLNRDKLRQALSSVIASTNGSICLVDDFGEALMPLGADPGFSARVQSNLAAVSDSDALAALPGQGDELAVRRRLTNGWSIVASLPQLAIRAEIRAMSLDILYICLGAILAAALIVTLLTNHLVRRIRRIAAFMSSVDIHSDEYTREGKGDELAVVETSFNGMLRATRESMHKEQEALRLKKEADLDVLQEQINPHFLYNCLDSINWLAIEHNATEISTMTNLLSRFFRLGLSRGDQIVLLQDELTHVKLYVEIIKMRFDGQLRVTFDVEPGLESVYTLKFVLQPLVENAIAHGIAGRPSQEGNVRISARRDGGELILTVQDDGAGMSLERLSTLRRALQTGARNAGFGLHNVNQRIRLHFGEAFQLQIDSESNIGTTVNLHLPADVQP